MKLEKEQIIPITNRKGHNKRILKNWKQRNKWKRPIKTITSVLKIPIKLIIF